MRPRKADNKRKNGLCRHELEFVQHFVHVRVDFYFAPRLMQSAIRSDQKSGPLDAHDLAPIHVLFFPDAVELRDFVVGVAEKQERQAVLIDETVVGLQIIGTHPDDYGAERFKLLDVVAEAACFARAPRGIVFWVKVKDNPFAAKVGKRNILSVRRKQREIGCNSTFLYRHSLAPVTMNLRVFSKPFCMRPRHRCGQLLCLFFDVDGDVALVIPVTAKCAHLKLVFAVWEGKA